MIKPHFITILKNLGTTKDKSQFSEPGEDEEQPFEIEPYNPNSSDDFENDDV